MFPSFAFLHTSIPGGRLSHRVVLLALVVVKLVASGCSTLMTSPRITQTATVINYQGTGISASASNEDVTFSNPRKIVCQSRGEALQLGQSFARETGARLLVTSGSDSMAPLIRGAVYVLVQPRPYDSISRGDLLVYLGRPNAAKPERTSMLHRAVLQDKGGWLMSGDNNRWSESWDRVTPSTYVGTVTTILEFPQS